MIKENFAENSKMKSNTTPVTSANFGSIIRQRYCVIRRSVKCESSTRDEQRGNISKRNLTIQIVAIFHSQSS
jgi:hypothetical protein